MDVARILTCLLFSFWINAHVGIADSGSQSDTKESTNKAWKVVEGGADKAKNGLNEAWESLDKNAQKAGKSARGGLNKAWWTLTGSGDRKEKQEEP